MQSTTSNSRLGRNPFQSNEKIEKTTPVETLQSVPDEIVEEITKETFQEATQEAADNARFEKTFEPFIDPRIQKIENVLIKGVTLAIFAFTAAKKAIEILREPPESN